MSTTEAHDDLLIRRLQYQYAAAQQHHDSELLRSCFAEDAAIVLPEQYGGSVSGRDAVIDFFESRFRAGLAADPGPTVYVLGQSYIEMSGPGKARGRWAMQNLKQRDDASGEPTWVISEVGQYLMEYVRPDDGWLIASLEFQSFGR